MNEHIVYALAFDDVCDAPTADVVEVVRCRDCKYQQDCVGMVVHMYRDPVLEETVACHCQIDFCNYGERKDDHD